MYFDVRNKYKEEFDVYGGRGSLYGNPFQEGTQETLVELYREWVARQPDLLRKAAEELRGRSVACFCKPKACHLDALNDVLENCKHKEEKTLYLKSPDTGIDEYLWSLYKKEPDKLIRLVFRDYLVRQSLWMVESILTFPPNVINTVYDDAEKHVLLIINTGFSEEILKPILNAEKTYYLTCFDKATRKLEDYLLKNGFNVVRLAPDTDHYLVDKLPYTYRHLSFINEVVTIISADPLHLRLAMVLKTYNYPVKAFITEDQI